MEFFGFEVPKTLEGKSFLPMLKDPRTPIRKEVFIEWGRFEIGIDGMEGSSQFAASATAATSSLSM